ncbi:hypothetical protein PVAP13_9NG664600 [Panicum virgatum]|uniref:Uncharacterized protein n=1 Tax=Panicum virgatum TaxID=38727 RepID=A0A8T0MYY9_PANVG|nr:hypothetical protein PVAP13_9NG664600 [Panicum virgatum]
MKAIHLCWATVSDKILLAWTSISLRKTPANLSKPRPTDRELPNGGRGISPAGWRGILLSKKISVRGFLPLVN